jgi:O-antigen/teichoic acid export membrane protein
MNRKKIKADLLLASLSHFIYKIVGYLVLTMLTRYLSKGDMGEFFFAASLAAFFALFTQLGTDNYLIREAAEKPETALQKFSEVISIRMILFAVYIFLLNGFTLIFKPEIAEVVLLTSIYVLLEQGYASFGSLFIGIKRIKYNVLAGVGTRILLVGFIFLIVALNGSLAHIISCYILANALLLGIAYVTLRLKVGQFNFSLKFDAVLKIIRLSFPFFILSVLSLIHFKVDSIMLGFLESYSVVATYEASYKLFEAAQFLTVPFGMIFLPIFSEMTVQKNWEEIQKLIKKLLTILFVLGSIAAVVVIAGAAFIIPFVFGDKYSDSIPILKILYLAVPLLYIVNMSIILTRSIYLEKKAIKAMLLCAILNIILNAIGIPLWSAAGAAWATVITETLLAVLLMKLNFKKLRNLNSEDEVNSLVSIYVSK